MVKLKKDLKNNTGEDNSGDWNSGNRNSGNRNSGNANSGDWNSGNWNSGNANSGNRNSGDWNSGNWNSGDWNSGFFNTDEPNVRIFNKYTDVKREDIILPNYCYFYLSKWVDFENMTKEEKETNAFAEHTGGYLKTYEYKEAWKLSFDKASKKDVAKTLELPNFDYRLFEEITGITKDMIEKKLNKSLDKTPKSSIVDGVEYIRKNEK